MTNIRSTGKRFLPIAFLLILVCGLTIFCFGQKPVVKFGKEINAGNLTTSEKKKDTPIQWMEVNTPPETWTLKKNGELVCTGHPIGVMRSEKEYENFILHVEWMHMEPGGNSGIFVWSSARPDEESR
ncbi:MAG TPA: family 16 glycoside hydrolase, partial [Chryseosolibacter sp.]